jgi:hypothetical protein
VGEIGVTITCRSLIDYKALDWIGGGRSVDSIVLVLLLLLLLLFGKKTKQNELPGYAVPYIFIFVKDGQKKRQTYFLGDL